MSKTIFHALSTAVLVAGCIVGTPIQAFAQTSSRQPIRLVVSLAPGGATDVGTRLMAAAYSEQTGQQTIVESRAGGGGTTAAMTLKQAPPDGHTLLVTDNAACCANVFLNEVGYDATKDFKPVLLLWGYPLILVVAGNGPIKSVADLVALARTNPGGLTYGSQGVGAGGHILGAMLAKAANLNLVHVPFRGAMPAAIEVAAGRADFLFASYASVSPLIEDGRLRPLATTAEKAEGGAVPGYPSLPTMADAGYPGVRLDAWFALFAPAGTPDETVQGLHRGFSKALHAENVMQKLRSLQMRVPADTTPEALAKRIREELAMVGPILKEVVQKSK